MNIKYEIHSIKNSNGKGEERHYAHLHEGTAMNADQLESHIEESCSLTKSDMEATLSALRAAMIRELSQGKRFYLPSIGSFSLSVDLNLPEGKPIEKMRGDYISVRNLNFRPAHVDVAGNQKQRTLRTCRCLYPIQPLYGGVYFKANEGIFHDPRLHHAARH